MFEIRELTLWSVVLRVLVAALLSGIIGLERGMKNRPAGLRTYMHRDDHQSICLPGLWER